MSDIISGEFCVVQKISSCRKLIVKSEESSEKFAGQLSGGRFWKSF